MSKRLGRDELQTLVLHVLLRGPSHGYAIARAIEQDSDDALRTGEGTLYPVLRALEQEELVTVEWQTPQTGPARKVYRITAAGRDECIRRVSQWRAHVQTISAVLGKVEPTHG